MKNNNYYRILIIASALLFGVVAKSQMRTTTGDVVETPAWPHHLTFGVGAGANLNYAMGDYLIDGNTYSTGIGFGPAGYLLLEIPLGADWMLVPRVSYNNLSTRFTDGDPGTSLPAGVGGSASDLAVNIQTVGADLLGKYSFSALHVLFGGHVGGMISKTYAHGSNSSAIDSDTDLPGTSDVFASLGLGFGVDIALNDRNTLWLTPEVFGSYPVTDLGDNSTLNIASVRGSVALKFDLNPTEAAPIQVPMAALEVSIKSYGVLPNGELTNEPVVPQQRIHSRVSLSLLPHVFFANGKSDIPARYSTAGATGFSVDHLAGTNEFDVNHEVLNIIGARLKQYPGTSITVTGCNANSGEERNNAALSRSRAMSVRDYLVQTWGIAGNRIVVDQRNLPELPTNPITKAGMEENRRVEFSSNDRRLLEPVKIESRQGEVIGETVIRFDISLKNEQYYNITDWKLSLDKNGDFQGLSQAGVGLPSSPIYFSIDNATAYINKPLPYEIQLIDDKGRVYSAEGTTRVVALPVERHNLEKYAMLSFDFDRSEINVEGREMIHLISESISRDATGVTVNGHCDNTGTDEYNQALSEARAVSAASMLRTMAPLPANVTVQGYGEMSPKYTNDLPEGRQLNRRVEVHVQKSSMSVR